jgi:hypothetical protein
MSAARALKTATPVGWSLDVPRLASAKVPACLVDISTVVAREGVHVKTPLVPTA